MNTVVTSREDILEHSRQLIQSHGWTALNIRALASACGISVGSIYNYFGSKAELLAATVESVWKSVFHVPGKVQQLPGFSACVRWIFDSMRKADEKYPGFFSMHSVSFMGEDKSSGQTLMARAWLHIKQGLHVALEADKNIREDAFDEDFTKEALVELVFSLMLASMMRPDLDGKAVQAMLDRLLY